MKTLDEYLNLIDECFTFTLNLTFDQLRRFPDKFTVGTILRDHSFLRYLLRNGPSDNSADVKLLEDICTAADSVPERKTLEALRSLVLNHAREAYPGPLQPNPAYEIGMSFRFDPPSKELPEGYACFHITNALAPKSFLNAPEYVIRNFRFIMDESEKKYGCHILYTATWLNSYDKWLRFFPDEWSENRSEPHPEIYGNLGFLGQFLNARGDLNYETVEFVLSTGRLMYPFRLSHCLFESMRNHLNKIEKQMNNKEMIA